MDLNRLKLLGIAKDRVLCGPRYVSLCLNNYCNNRCLYCATHSPLADKSGFKAAGMDFALAKKLIDQAAAWGSREVLITGLGEPTLHPEFKEIAGYIKRKKLMSALTTNALFGKKEFPAVAAIDYVLVNLSAPEERLYTRLQSPHDKTSFMKALVNISALVKLKKSCRSPYVTLVFVINSMNCRSVPGILALAEKLGVHNVRFRCMEHTKETEALLLSNKQKLELLSIIARELKTSRGIRHNLEVIKSTILDCNGVHDINHCYAGWFMMEVDFAGKVRICADKTVIGDMKKGAIKGIWRSPEAHKMRLRLKYNLRRDKPFLGIACRLCCRRELNLAVDDALKQYGERGLNRTSLADILMK